MHHRAHPACFVRSLLASALCGACLVAGTIPAAATCGSANCFLVTGTREGVAARGALTVDLSYRYVVQDRKLSGTRRVSEVVTPRIDFENRLIEPDHHREIRTQNTLVQLDLAFGLTARLTLGGSLPLINDRDHEHFDDVGMPSEHFTSEDGTSGFGDARLEARYALALKPHDLLVGGLAVKLPTGQFRLLDSEGRINEPGMQPGTGSIDAIASLHYARQISPMRLEWFLSGSYRLNGANSLDYRLGNEMILNSGLSWRTGDRVTCSLQINGRTTPRDRYLGDEVPATGGAFVNLTPGLRVTGSSGTQIYGFVQVPVYQRVNEANLAPGAGLLVGVSKSF
ncbi:MAG TPA: hypothetical protein VFT43_13305 [Candidatus Polarisedimenticolia bacterium]|nr:hypothetical protein [Candidatus Polarisedimenticolia bacterium]